MPQIPKTGNIVAARVPDIKVPLFSPSYSVPYNAGTNIEFSFNSLDAVAAGVNSVNGLGIKYAQFFAITPFGYGETSINPIGVASGSWASTLANSLLRWGNIAMVKVGGGGGSIGTYMICVSYGVEGGVIVSLNPSMQIEKPALNASSGNNYDVGDIFMGADSSLGPSFIQQVSNNGNENYFNIYPVEAPIKLAEQSSVAPWTGVGTAESIISGIPLFVDSNNGQWATQFWWADSSANQYIGQMFMAENAFLFTYSNQLTYDNATINTALVNISPAATTPYGWLLRSSTIVEGQALNVLVSPDGSKYALIKYIPQSNQAAKNAPYSGSQITQGVTIDREGILYMRDINSTGASIQYLNSFALDITDLGVPVPALAFPPVSIPGLCGCSPYSPQE